MTDRSALVTGGTGFLGSCLVRHLLEDGWNVTLLTRAASRLDIPEAGRSNVRIVRTEARGGADETARAVDRAVELSNPDVVLSLATLRDASSTIQAAEQLDANVRLPALLVAALAARGGGRIVTTASYMHRPAEIPPSLYSATRSSIDPILDWASSHANVDACTLSLTSVYGPGDTRSKVLAALFEAATTGKPIDMVHPDRMLDLVHVDDVARACLHVARGLVDGSMPRRRRFDVTAGTGTTLRALVELIELHTGRRINARWSARSTGPSDDVNPPLEPAWPPAWMPRISMDDGCATSHVSN